MPLSAWPHGAFWGSWPAPEPQTAHGSSPVSRPERTYAALATTRRPTATVEPASLEQSNDAALVAVIAHGRCVDELTYIELAPGEPVTMADVLAGRLPARLALIICEGTESVHDEEPLALGTVVLARGTSEVLTTSMTLSDSPITARIVDAALYRMQNGESGPAALAAAFRRVHESLQLDRYPLGTWAALTVLGAGHPPNPPTTM